MIRWQDISQWQPGERRDSPNRLVLHGPNIHALIEERAGAWRLSCAQVGLGNHYLGVIGWREARRAATATLQERLERALTDVHSAKAGI